MYEYVGGFNHSICRQFRELPGPQGRIKEQNTSNTDYKCALGSEKYCAWY